jgi:hypothetical protein
MKLLFKTLLLLSATLFLTIIFKHSTFANDTLFLDRPLEFEILPDGNFLVTDGGGSNWTTTGSEIFIFDKKGVVIWHFDQNLKFAHSAHLFSNNQIVVTDTTNDRIISIDFDSKQVIWSSDDWSQGTGQLSDGSHLDYPNEALELSNHHLLVTDRNNDRILEIDHLGKIYWQYTDLDRPHNASQLPDGNFIISNSESHQVIKIDPQGAILWEYDGKPTPLNWPRDVQALSNGNYLITDTRNHRVIEVNSEKQIIWEYSQNLYWPYESERLSSGNTLISDSQNTRLLEVTPDKQIYWQLSLRPSFKTQPFHNGNFESISNHVPKGWTTADLLAEGSGTFSLDSSTAYSANNSARIDYQGQGHIFWLQQVPVVQEKEYQFSGWLKTDLHPDSGNWSRYELWWKTDLGGYIDPPLISDKSSFTSDWTQREWTGLAPSGASFVEIRALTTGSGTTWFDHVSWQTSSKIPPYLYPLAGFILAILLYAIFTLFIRPRSHLINHQPA